MSQLASAVIAAVGSGFVEMTAQSDPREGETARYSIARAKQLYGWIPQRTLDESLLNVVNKTSKEIGK
jgi:nucleoside-diphosphate-sugar epimerase